MKYIGNGTAYPGIPARDLSAEEVEKFGREFLLTTGLYKEDMEEKSKSLRTAKADKPLPDSDKES